MLFILQVFWSQNTYFVVFVGLLTVAAKDTKKTSDFDSDGPEHDSLLDG